MEFLKRALTHVLTSYYSLLNSHCWAHFPEEVCGWNDLGPVVWGTESSVNLLKNRTLLHVQK